jgi:hypothetical protein
MRVDDMTPRVMRALSSEFNNGAEFENAKSSLASDSDFEGALAL